MIINSKDLLINQTRLPDRKSEEYKPFWQLEKTKCESGLYIDGFYFSGFLYWHLNMYKTLLDIDEGNGRIIRKMGSPYLRDNEWFLDSKIQEANNWKNNEGEIRKKGVCALGTRRFSKTVMQSSWLKYNATFFKGSQNAIVGGSKDQIKLITDEIDRFDASLEGEGNLNQRHAFYKERIERDWKTQVTYGKLDQQGNKFPYSYIPTRNVDGGTNTEVGAGLTPHSIVFDEIGTYPFLQALKAILPGLDTPYGWRCVPLAMGTGGDMDNFKDALDLFDNPDAHNFLVTEIPEENRKCAVYLPGWMSYDVPKKPYRLTDYIKLDSEKYPNLSKIGILVGDRVLGEEIINKKRKDAEKSNDPTALLKVTMYYPLNTREIFLSEANNKFPLLQVDMQIENLKNYEPLYIDLYRDDHNKVQWRNSSLNPINIYPVSPKDFKDACGVCYELPDENVPAYTYTIGIDPYNEDVSSAKINSLGSITVYKRMYDPMGTFQNSIVFTWAGRKKEIKQFHEMCLMVSEWYNAIGSVLPENEDKTLIQYFFFKRKGYFLADSFELAKEINPNTKSHRLKGLSASTKNQNHYMNLEYEETKEETIIIDEEGNEDTKMGVFKIPDIMLLTEMKHYRGKPSSSKGVHDCNADRIISYGHALTLARHFDVKYPRATWQPKPKEQAPVKKESTVIHTAFGTFYKGNSASSLFTKPTSKKHNWFPKP